MLTQNDTQQHFDTSLFLQTKVKAREYFFYERLNYGRSPNVIEILAYLRNFYVENELPSIPTVSRWHSSWKRSN
jgi:hypothetical protein